MELRQQQRLGLGKMYRESFLRSSERVPASPPPAPRWTPTPSARLPITGSIGLRLSVYLADALRSALNEGSLDCLTLPRASQIIAEEIADVVEHLLTEVKEARSMKLQVVVEQDEAGYYAAEVPALPGCLSQGRHGKRPSRMSKKRSKAGSK